jgi:putative transposase
MNSDIFKTAPHNPPHLFLPDMLYMLTASIYKNELLIQSSNRKLQWIETFVKSAEIYGWQIVAWVVLNNHYHAIIRSPEKTETLSKFIASYHKYTARCWNEEEQLNKRKVWWNYWDTCIRSEHDYYNRLRYVFWNPVKHGLAENPEEYLFSNYKDFLLSWQVDFNFTNMDEATDVPEY